MGAKELKQKKAAGVGSDGPLQLKYTPEDSDLSSHQRTQLGLTRGYSLCHHWRGGRLLLCSRVAELRQLV